VVVLLAATPAQARCFAIWHYKFPQHCRAEAYAALPHRNHRVVPPERKEDIPLPNLDWIACPQGDERLEGIAKLRLLMDGR
jgi:hypothetical protein